jgi:23S rRNA pseudouridine1911/1915/1917 synthase
MMIIEEIPRALDGERVDRIVSLLADISRSVAHDLVAHGGVEIDGVVETSGKIRLREGQRISIDISKIPPPQLPQADASVEIDVIYSDESIIIVNKQPGLVVHPGAGNPDKTLVNGMLAHFPEIAGVGQPMRPGIVHRLDSGTSGLMVVARTHDTYEYLVSAMSDHDVTREYVALAWGHFDAESGVIDADIGRDPRDPLKMAVVHNGKWARTHFVVEETFNEPADVSLVRCSLETGRTHQIRVHLAAVSHPVVGDATYGGAKSSLIAPRPMLHAQRLAFHHPVTNEQMSFEVPIPADMASVIAQCGRHGTDSADDNPHSH